MVHRVAVVASQGVIAYELAVPVEVFGRVHVGGEAPYAVDVCAEAPRVRAGAFDIVVQHDLHRIAQARTVIVPGLVDASAANSPAIVAALQEAAANGARIASICSGAFVLAEAGLLDGRRATTHWLAAATLAARYPRIDVDANVLFVDEGQILTSAEASSGLDLCLYLVRQDHGTAVAAEAARLAVVPLERAGGQAQFIVYEPPASAKSLGSLLAWMSENLGDDLNVGALARQAGTSERTLSRRFRAQTGTTPLQWAITARVRRAQQLLETTSLSIERIATEVGFETAASLRERFGQIVGVSPNAYRRAFGGGMPSKVSETLRTRIG